jgi:hypothetical protein
MRADATSGFSRTTLRVIVPAIAVSVLVALWMQLFGDPTAPPSSGASSASRSALGHGAFVELLERSGFPVVTSHLPARVRAGALLVMAEPEVDASEATRQHLRDQLEGWERVLLVLPKRTGEPDEEHPGWVASTGVVDEGPLNDLLDDLGLDVHVERPADELLRWEGGAGSLPSLSRPQLVVGRDLRPQISCERGILVGQLTDDDGSDRRRYVLSDPDLLANHGLGKGDNAALLLEVVNDLVAAGTPIVIDETLHGGVRPSGLWNALRQFPLVLIVAHGLLTLAVLLLATGWRFGPPVPVPEVLVRGKTTLLDHAARLLTGGRHERAILQRYLRQALHDVAEARHLATEADAGERTEHLARLSRRLGVAEDPRELVDAVAALDERSSPSANRTLRLARRIHTWREEMTHGPGSNS